MSQYKKHRVTIIALFIMLFWCTTQFFWGERTPVRNGLGYDGAVFADITSNFDSLLFHKSATEYFTGGIGSYQMSRILPCAIIHYTMKLFGIPFSATPMANAWFVTNVLLYLLSIWIMGLIFSLKGFSQKVQVLGFILIFVNVGVLKIYLYNPVFTDVWALFSGVVSLYFFIRQYRVALLLSSLVLGFAWPTTLYFAAPLLVLGTVPVQPSNSKMFPLLVVIGISAALVLGIFYTSFIMKFENPYGGEQYNEWLKVPSLILVVAFLVLSIFPLVNFNLTKAIKASATKRNIFFGILVLIAFVVTKLFISHFQGYQGPHGMRGFLRNALIRSIIDPLVFLVAHIVYYGPLIFFLIFNYKSFVSRLHQNGLGLTVFFLMVLVLSINSESRQLINVIPFVSLFVVEILKPDNWSNKQWLALIATSILFSKIWLPVNLGTFKDNPLEFPDQLIDMNAGPWMIHSMYYVQGSIVLLTLGLFYFLFNKKSQAIHG